MEKAKKMAWHLLAASVGLLTLSQLAHADSLDEQRNRYAQIKQAWDNRQMDVVDQLMPTLSTYPLYPYLQYRQITDDLMNQPALVVKNFIDANPTLPPARSLRSRFVNELPGAATGAAYWRLVPISRPAPRHSATITTPS